MRNLHNFCFTNLNSQAFENNLVLIGSKYCIFSGDVNQQGVVDGIDLGIVDNDAYNFVTGYVNSDVDGNNVSDALDLSIVDNNAFNFVSKNTPIV